MKDNWYRDALCKMHFDMHTPGDVENVARGFDGPAFARLLKDAGVEAVCFFSKCAYGWSYYPTRVGLKHPHLERDLLGEAVEACREAGIKFIAYYCIEILPPPLAERHPEWLAREADGSPHLNSERYMFCPNGPAPGEIFLPQLKEIVTEYPVDGIFLDGYGALHHVCHCENCREAFGEIPAGPAAPRRAEYLEWQKARLHELFSRAGEAVHSCRSDALLGVNWLGCIRYAEDIHDGIDYLTADYPVKDNCALWTSYQLAGWAGRELPRDVMNARMLHWWTDWSCRPAEAIRAEFAASIAHGGTLFLGDVLPVDSAMPDADVIELAKDAFDFARERKGLLSGTEPLADVAVIMATDDRFGHGRGSAIDEAPLRGAFMALAEHGVTAHVLRECDLPDELEGYKAAVICGQAGISDRTANLLEGFVSGGGGLVVCGAAGEKIPGLSGVLGIECADGPSWDRAYFRVPDEWASRLWPDYERARPKVLVHGAPALVRPAGADAICPLISPGPIYQLRSRPPGDTTEYPALTMNAYGEGRAAFCALPLARDLFARANVAAGHVLAGLVRAVAPLTVEVSAPASVQVALARREGQFVVHLLWYHAERRSGEPPIVNRIPDLHGVRLTVRDDRKPVRVVQEPGGRELEWTAAGDAIKMDVAPFRIHTAVVISFC